MHTPIKIPIFQSFLFTLSVFLFSILHYIVFYGFFFLLIFSKSKMSFIKQREGDRERERERGPRDFFSLLLSLLSLSLSLPLPSLCVINVLLCQLCITLSYFVLSLFSRLLMNQSISFLRVPPKT